MLSERLNAVLAHRGANDPITATDLRRALDVLAEEIPSREGMQQTARELLDYQQVLNEHRDRQFAQEKQLQSDRAALKADREAFEAEKSAAGVDAADLDDEQLREVAAQAGVTLPEGATRDQIEAALEMAEADTVLADPPTTYAELAAKGDHTTLLKPLDE